jgi:competence protein ComGC
VNTKGGKSIGSPAGGWTKGELLVVIAVVVVLLVVLLPALARVTSRVSKQSCVNHMKQIGTGFRLWAYEHEQRYPFSHLSATYAGNATNLWKLFQMAADDISSPRILVCPQDSERRPALDFLTETNAQFSSKSFSHPSKRHSALSYFYGLDGTESLPGMILIGDRNLTRDPTGSDISPGEALLKGEQRLGSSTNETRNLRWSSRMHDRGGNLAFMDGGVRQLTSPQLREAARKSGDTTNRVWMPN